MSFPPCYPQSPLQLTDFTPAERADTLPLFLLYPYMHSVVLTSRDLRVPMVGSLKMNTALEYSTRVVQEGDRRCKKSTLNDLAYLTPLRIPLMNPVLYVEHQYGALTMCPCIIRPWRKNCTKYLFQFIFSSGFFDGELSGCETCVHTNRESYSFQKAKEKKPV
jgi:hypothetical protein